MEKYNKFILILIAVVVIGMSIGYSALNSNLSITGDVNYRPQEDVRVTKFVAKDMPSDVVIEYSDYSKHQVKLGYTNTEEQETSITYTVEVTNYSNVSMGIIDIIGLDDNVEIQEGIIGTKLVGPGEDKTFIITFNSTTAETKTYLLTIEFGQIFDITYSGLGNTDDYIKGVMEGEQLSQELGKDAQVCSVTMSGRNYTNYTFSNGTIIIPSVTGDVVINGYSPVTESPTTPNAPELNGDMIPVYYEATSETTGEWRKADESNLDNKWYDYASQKWANAVTVVANSYAPKSNGIEEVNFVNQVYNSYKSTNQGKDSTTSNLTLKFKTGSTGGTLSFDYQVSSEQKYDKLNIKVNGESAVTDLSGNSSNSFSKVLEANASYTIVADYSKDNSGNGNSEDTATISNLVVPSDLAEPLTVASTGNYKWVQMYEYEVASSYELDGVSGTYSLKNVESHDYSLNDIGKYMCRDGSTSCSELYKITNVEGNTIKKVEKYGTESVDRNYYKTADVDTVIPMSAINTMWVWIPRYSYTIKSEDGTNYYGKKTSCTMPTQKLPGEIDVKFISKDDERETGSAQYIGDEVSGWYTNEAFDFPETDTNTPKKRGGIWVSKFEPTGTVSSCTNTSCDVSSVTVKPNKTSIRSKTVSNFYFMSRSMQVSYADTYGFDKNSGDLHMMKNDEWGAVAYLSQSRYGKYGNSEYTGANKEVYINNDGGYITGHSGGGPSASSSATKYAYNDMTNLGDGQGQAGPGASTTGNITGIYDMSGGAYEYVMGVLEYDEQGVEDNAGKIATGSSGFKGLSSSGGATGSYGLPNEKYYNKYKSANPTSSTWSSAKPESACNRGVCYGHALSETSSWYSDYAGFVNRSYPWFLRGGYYSYTTSAGVFGVNVLHGNSAGNSSCRLAFAP